MATAKANHLPALALAVIRPALVEAKLLTDKHARDAVYVVTLAEELRSIEEKIAAMEETLQLVSQQADALAVGRACRPPQGGPDAHWIRAKSSELSQRLRRIQQSGERELSHL
jgi:hypothetical protein